MVAVVVLSYPMTQGAAWRQTTLASVQHVQVITLSSEAHSNLACALS